MQAVQDKDADGAGQGADRHGGHVLRNLWHSLFGAPVLGTPPEGLKTKPG
jgi:acyl-CoA dehydrogenase